MLTSLPVTDWTRPSERPVFQPDKARQATLQSTHATVAEAFADLDAISMKMMRTGTPSNAIELVVVDDNGRQVERPDSH